MNLVHTLSHSIGVLATESGPNNGPGAWMPELRGILTVIIGVFVLMGSVYFIMMTNMGRDSPSWSPSPDSPAGCS